MQLHYRVCVRQEEISFPAQLHSSIDRYDRGATTQGLVVGVGEGGLITSTGHCTLVQYNEANFFYLDFMLQKIIDLSETVLELIPR